jgi:hypothetical protein
MLNIKQVRFSVETGSKDLLHDIVKFIRFTNTYAHCEVINISTLTNYTSAVTVSQTFLSVSSAITHKIWKSYVGLFSL